MRLLVIGGTAFVGRAVVEAAVAKGHTVTMFNRGQRNPHLFPQLETIVGDRDGDLSGLKGRRFDAVIDTCGYIPRVVAKSAKLLADNANHYTFVSTLSVYQDFRINGIDEMYPVGKIEDETVEERTGDTYGPLKALCEKEVQAAFPNRSLIVRPGMIVGPNDHTDRFTYWVARVARGGEMLAPGRPDRQLQVIDVRDLAEWILRSAEARLTGVYNAAGPDLTMQQVLDTAKEVTKRDVRMTWVADSFLDTQPFEPYSLELPFWFSDSNQEDRGLFSVNSDKARNAGLTYRPLVETIRDIWLWSESRPSDHEWRTGLTTEKERALLESWKEYQLQNTRGSSK